MGIQSAKANQSNGWKRRLAFVAGLGLIILWVTRFAPAAPDPNAIKVQGSDTVGNPLLIQVQGQGTTGTVQTPSTVSSNNANTAQNLSLVGAAGKFTYVTGFQVTGSGATAASVINVTLVGVVGGTNNYTVVVPAGVTTSITPLVVTFPTPVPSSAVNTNITLSIPAFGAGNTNQAGSIQGFTQ